MPELQAGTIVAQDYRVVRPLAEGGMGAVFVAEQLSTGKLRALKVMHTQLLSNPQIVAKFVQEARISAKIESDHVVEVVGAGVDEQLNIPWLAMEMLKGSDLAGWIRARGPMNPGELLEIFAQLCHALAAAHAVGLVHRDLKPENVFMAEPRRTGVPFMVKVLDFGIAKLLQEHQTSGTATGTMGSPMWMAPEQAKAERIHAATDVWALGLIAFHLLTGTYYWKACRVEGATVHAVLAEILFEPIEPASIRAARLGCPTPLPQGFDGWFARCLERDPTARFPNAGEAFEALRRSLTSPGKTTAPPQALPAFASPVRQTGPLETQFVQTASPVVATAPNAPRAGGYSLALGVGAMVLVAGGIFAGLRLSRSPPVAAPLPTPAAALAPPPPAPAQLPVPVQREPPPTITVVMPRASGPADASVRPSVRSPRERRRRVPYNPGDPSAPTELEEAEPLPEPPF